MTGIDRAAAWTASIAVGGLVAGFGVAQVTGVRWLGGLVLVAAAAVAGARWQRRGGWRRAALLVAVGFAAFVVSHPLGRAIGAWPSVLLVAAVAAAVSIAVDRTPAGQPVPMGQAAP